MDTKDTAETTTPSVTPARFTPKPKPAGETEPEDPVPSVPLIGLEDEPLGSLGAAFGELHVRTLEGKAKEKETGEGGAEDNREGEHARTEDRERSRRNRTPCSILSYGHYTPSYTLGCAEPR